MPVSRTPWGNFPNVTVHSLESSVSAHSAYSDAKAGDFRAARAIARDFLRPDLLPWRPDFIAPVIRLDSDSAWNPLPLALGERLSLLLGAKIVPSIVQDNIVPIFPSDSINRLLLQPSFTGNVPKGSFLIVDETINFGPFLSNLRGHIETNGGKVAAATTLSAGIFSTRLKPDPTLTTAIRSRFGNELSIIKETLGFESACLTQKESLFVNGLSTLISLRNPDVATHRVVKPSL